MWAINSSSSVSTPLRSRCRIGFGLIGTFDIFDVSSIDPGVWAILDGSPRLFTIKITSWGWDGAEKKKQNPFYFICINNE